jgi:sugar lactone lactonase YvrE
MRCLVGCYWRWLFRPLSVLLPLWSVACSKGKEPSFQTPESCYYDVAHDVYLVSNIHGGPLEKDGNGFILKVSPEDGSRTMWISGEQAGVTLHAPKGMAIAGEVLWVADIDVLRKFDRNSGEPLGEVVIPGATFLNDVSAGPDGSVYCTDSGLDSKFAATGTDAIWRVAPDGVVAALIQGVDLGQPNGLSAQPGGLYVVSWRDGTFYQVDYRGMRTDLGKAPQGQLDGLVRAVVASKGPDGKESKAPAWFATSWVGSAIYRFDLAGAVTAVPVRLEQPADLGYDSKRNCLLVPLFGSDRLHVERL